MENFFNWISKPMDSEDVEIWFNMNNMIPEKGELFFDFCVSLFTLMKETYLEYFNSFFMEVYYTQKNNNVRDSIDSFLKDLFNRKIPFTKSDLELYTELYKLLDKNISQ